MAFTKEDVEKILAGQEENDKKAELILSLYNDDLNGLKLNRDDIKKERDSFKAKLDELSAANAKSAEDYAALQKKLEANSPEEIKKAYEQKQTELEKSYQGAISERDTKLKKYEEQLAAALSNERYLKCVQEFNRASTNFDIEPSGRDFILSSIVGTKGENFSERDLGNGLQLIDRNGKTIEGSLRAFFETDVGKKFLRNSTSGGGAQGGTTPKGTTEKQKITVSEFNNLSSVEQAIAARDCEIVAG